jgi:hypothetical protein
MTAIGPAINPVFFDSQLPELFNPALSTGINTSPLRGAPDTGYGINSVSSLIKADALSASNISSGEMPAVRAGLISKLSGTTTGLIKGAGKVASTAVNSSISATKELGNVIFDEVLPKPEPLSTTMIRNKFLSGIIVGGFLNGMRGLAKVVEGEANQDQAVQTVVKETTIGAIGGLSFAGGMGATASIFGKMLSKVPLSIAGLTVGTIAAVGVTELLKATVPAFGD